MYRRKLLLDSMKLFDLALMLASFALSILVVSSNLRVGSFADLVAMRIRLPNFAIFIGFMIAWHMIFSFFELYQSRRLSSGVIFGGVPGFFLLATYGTRNITHWLEKPATAS